MITGGTVSLEDRVWVAVALLPTLSLHVHSRMRDLQEPTPVVDRTADEHMGRVCSQLSVAVALWLCWLMWQSLVKSLTEMTGGVLSVMVTVLTWLMLWQPSSKDHV